MMMDEFKFKCGECGKDVVPTGKLIPLSRKELDKGYKQYILCVPCTRKMIGL